MFTAPVGFFSLSSGGGGGPGGGGTTLNPADSSDQLTFSNGNLTVVGAIGGAHNLADPFCRSTTSKSSGKYYFEATAQAASGNLVGIANSTLDYTNASKYPGADSNGMGYYFTGLSLINGSSIGSSPTFANGDTIGIAVDFSANRIWMANITASPTTWNAGGSADPATGVGGVDISGLAGGPYFVCPSPVGVGDGQITVNFGDATFVGSVPSGFSAWG